MVGRDNPSEPDSRAPEFLESLLPEETQRALQDLRVHRMQLEMQNEELRRAQAELDAMRERYFDLYDLAPVGYCTLSEAGIILEANLTAATILGAVRGGLIKEPISRFILKEDQDVYYLHRQRLFAAYLARPTELPRASRGHADVPQAFEIRMLSAASGPIWVRVEATVVGDRDGALMCRVAMSDITARKRAEEALRDAHWRLESIIESTCVGTWEWNVQTGETIFNEAWAQIIGYTIDELRPISIETWETFVHPDDLKRSGELLDRHFAGNLHYYDCDCRMRHKGGYWVWVHDRGRVVTRSGDGKPQMMFGTHTDITLRKQTEDALRRSEELNRLLVATSMDAVLMTAPDGRIYSANDAARRMFGRTEEELIRLGRVGIVDNTDCRLNPALEELAQTGWFHGELMLVRGDGSTFPGELSSAVFKTSDGEMRASMLIRDTSERKQAEEELRSSRQQLRTLNARMLAAREEERTEVAREIHDVLAQELTRLKIDLVWLLGRLNKPEADVAHEGLAVHVKGMCRMVDESIRCVQDIATSLRPAVLDSLGLCPALEWQARDFQDRTGIQCHAEVPAVEPSVDPDSATAIFRILQESLTNILRHAAATGVEIVLRQEAGQLVLWVQDNGCGIEPEVLGSPFSIGLAGMRERALLLDGQFVIRSQPGSGTTVEVRLPFPVNDGRVKAKP